MAPASIQPPVFALADLGSREYVVLAWLVAGCIALCGALSYGMLVRGVTESGGEYLYLSRSIHPVAGFVAGWISLLAGFPGAIAFAATALETYSRSAIPELALFPADSIAVAVVLLAGVIHVINVEFGARTHEYFVAVMLLVLSVIIVWSAATYTNSTELPALNTLPMATFSGLAFANSLVWISLSYSGFNAAAYVAGEVPNAEKVVPRGMVIGTVLTMVLCVVVNAIMLYSDDPLALSGQPEIAVIAAQALGGDSGRVVIEIVIAVSLLTSITAMAMAGPRVYAKMAEDGALPRIFAKRGDQPPRAAIMLQVAVAVLLIVVSDLRGLLSYLGLTLSLCLALAVSSLFVRHWRLSDVPSSRFYPIAPLVFVACTVLFAILSAFNNIGQFIAVVPTILAGVVAYWVSVYVSKRTGS